MFLERILELVYPTRCVSCGKGGALLCPECAEALVPPKGWDCIVCGKPAVAGVTHPVCRGEGAPERFLAAFAYRGPARRLVKALKYRRVRRVAEIMAGLMAEGLAETGVEFGPKALVVPIPLSFWRQGSRGFNQAELLARALAERLKLKVRGDLLTRPKDTLSQVSLGKAERKENVKGIFAANGRLRGRDVLLVDDVVTTGATAREAARVLKKSGANQVWVLSFARD